MTEDTRCPVCSEEFGNPGALGTHLSLTKDAQHVAHRAGAPALPEAPPASPVLLPALPAPINGYGAPGEAGEAPSTEGRGEADRQEAGA